MLVCPCAIEIPLRSALRGDGGSGKLLIDFFVYARAAKFAGNAYRVLNGVRVRASMRDDGDAADTQQRSAAGFRRVGALAEIVESALRQCVADLRTERALDGFLQHTLDVLDEAFA